MTLHAATLETPVGQLSLLVTGDTLVACGFAPPETLCARLPDPQPLVRRQRLGLITGALQAYLDGELDAIDAVPVRQQGSDDFHALWTAIRRVPAGMTVTYGQLATLAGRPHAVRAAGRACATNLIAVVVPCHRVVRMGGDLGGYTYGLPVKQWLLEHEHARQPVRLRR